MSNDIIRHRLSRESKVLRCVNKNKNSNLDELLPLVYDDVPEMLHPIARMSLLAHLIKLQDEEKIKRLDEGDQLIGKVHQEFLMEVDFMKKIKWAEFLAYNVSSWAKEELKKAGHDIEDNIVFWHEDDEEGEE